jgi:hypothetical protein
MGIGNRCDVGLGELVSHPKGKGSPTTAQFQNILSVFQVSMFTCQTKGEILGVTEGVSLFVVIATTVFEVFSKGVAVKLRGYFVVLFIGFLGQYGHGGGIRFVDVLLRKLGISFAVIGKALV